MTDLQYKLNTKIVSREEEGESLLFDPETGQVKVLNETATLIYELIKQNLTREKIIESVTCEYDNVNRQELESCQMDKKLIITLLSYIKLIPEPE